MRHLMWISFQQVLRGIEVKIYYQNMTTIPGDMSYGKNVLCSLFPGKDPHNFYVCTGKFPSVLAGTPVKQNTASNVLLLASLLLQVFAGSSITVHRYKQNQKDRAETRTGGSINDNIISKQSLINLTMNTVMFMLLMGIMSVLRIVNATNLATFEVYPNYIWLYVFHHFAPTATHSTAVTIIYVKNSSLITYASSELSKFGIFFQTWMQWLFQKSWFDKFGSGGGLGVFGYDSQPLPQPIFEMKPVGVIQSDGPNNSANLPV